MNIKKALVVAAHPDDEVLGVGGTIPLIKENGGYVSVVIVTDGSTTQYGDNEQIMKQKKEQAYKANEILGTDRLIWWDFPDMRLDEVPHYRLNKAFEDLIKAEQFDTIFVQNRSDINLDHQIVHHSVLVATRPYPGQPVKSIFSYYVNSSTEWGQRTSSSMFWPNIYIDITSTIEKKLRAMEVYQAEIRNYPHPRSIKALRIRAMAIGNEVGFEYAEPFQLILMRGNIFE